MTMFLSSAFSFSKSSSFLPLFFMIYNEEEYGYFLQDARYFLPSFHATGGWEMSWEACFFSFQWGCEATQLPQTQSCCQGLFLFFSTRAIWGLSLRHVFAAFFSRSFSSPFLLFLFLRGFHRGWCSSERRLMLPACLPSAFSYHILDERDVDETGDRGFSPSLPSSSERGEWGFSFLPSFWDRGHEMRHGCWEAVSSFLPLFFLFFFSFFSCRIVPALSVHEHPP